MSVGGCQCGVSIVECPRTSDACMIAIIRTYATMLQGYNGMYFYLLGVFPWNITLVHVSV